MFESPKVSAEELLDKKEFAEIDLFSNSMVFQEENSMIDNNVYLKPIKNSKINFTDCFKMKLNLQKPRKDCLYITKKIQGCFNPFHVLLILNSNGFLSFYFYLPKNSEKKNQLQIQPLYLAEIILTNKSKAFKE